MRIKKWLTFKIFSNNNPAIFPDKNTNKKISEVSFPLYQSLINFDPDNTEKTETGKNLESTIRGGYRSTLGGSRHRKPAYTRDNNHNDYP
jgi:hypothetical protein